MKYCSRFQFTLLLLFALVVIVLGCASTPQALVPSSAQVIGLAVIPQTEAGERALGRKQPVIVFDNTKQDALFSVLEINKDDAPVSNLGFGEHDFVVRWKIRNEQVMDRSQLYLRLNEPRTFIYESDLGSSTKKYVIRVENDDAKIVWSAIGVMPPGL